MKKLTALMIALLITVSLAVLTGCSSQTKDPGTPPENVIHPGSAGNSSSGSNGTGAAAPSGSGGAAYDGDVLENAVTVRIGKGESRDWAVDMYHNAAAATMLNYLSNTDLLFPTYTYEEERGFVAQSVRGSYTRDDETTVTDIKAGELYLFSGGQLRLYFKDVTGANITATPVGYFADTNGLADAVIDAYESNKGDTWGVDVYFIITKNMD